MLSPTDLQQLYRYGVALAGEPEAGYELVYDGMKELFRSHPRGLREPNPYAFRFLGEFAERSGRAKDGAPAYDAPAEWPDVEPLDEERLARIEGLLAGMVTSGAPLFSENEYDVSRLPAPWYHRIGKPWQRGLIAAAAILALLLIPARGTRVSTPEKAMEHMERIHLEAGLESWVPESVGATVREAAGGLEGTGFEPVEPGVVIVPERWEVAGASRCGFPGNKGCVVVRLKEKTTGERYSLVETRIPAALDAEGLTGGSGLEGGRDGVIVRLWEEQGLLFGLVGPR